MKKKENITAFVSDEKFNEMFDRVIAKGISISPTEGQYYFNPSLTENGKQMINNMLAVGSQEEFSQTEKCVFTAGLIYCERG